MHASWKSRVGTALGCCSFPPEEASITSGACHRVRTGDRVDAGDADRALYSQLRTDADALHTQTLRILDLADDREIALLRTGLAVQTERGKFVIRDEPYGPAALTSDGQLGFKAFLANDRPAWALKALARKIIAESDAPLAFLTSEQSRTARLEITSFPCVRSERIEKSDGSYGILRHEVLNDEQEPRPRTTTEIVSA